MGAPSRHFASCSRSTWPRQGLGSAYQHTLRGDGQLASLAVASRRLSITDCRETECLRCPPCLHFISTPAATLRVGVEGNRWNVPLRFLGSNGGVVRSVQSLSSGLDSDESVRRR